ncbi:MAG TPA: hypothetical protein VGN12_30205 [Pirellulales bacterium]|jgi:hypothetical protein
MNERFPHDDRDAALDRLLSEARWPEPTTDQIVRLRDRWRKLNRASRRRRQLLTAFGVAAAASLLIVGSWNSWWLNRVPNVQIPHARELARAGNDGRAVPSAIAGQGRGVGPQLPLVREPTLYERVVLTRPISIRQKREFPRTTAKRKSAAAAQARANWNTLLAEAALITPEELARGTGRLTTNAIQYQQQLRKSAQRHTDRLIADTAGAIRHARELSISLRSHAQAVESLARQGELQDVVNWLVREPDRGLRRRLLVELVSRGNDESVGIYLAFVARPECRVEALSALADADQPPIAVIIAYLGSSNVPLRNAAALALGTSSDPEVVRALVSSLDDARLRQPALVALLLNRTPQAATVLNEAREDIYLVASVRAAELELQHRNN